MVSLISLLCFLVLNKELGYFFILFRLILVLKNTEFFLRDKIAVFQMFYIEKWISIIDKQHKMRLNCFGKLYMSGKCQVVQS